jgi:hypothetical protein
MNRWLEKINDLKSWQVACAFAVIGLAVFFSGLANPFQNDDTFQIVNNPPVHSIKNFPQFFQAGTYWDGQRLTGSYYRPMMTTAFSLIYTLFGAHPVAFHVVQLSLYIASAFLLYLVFKRFLKPAAALLLSLLFLVHPLNSQIVYSIATMQDVLFFFFGILALYLLMRSDLVKSLWAVSACLLLSLLSKEAGFVFIIVSLLYLFWFNKERILAFLGVTAVPVIIYLALRSHAVGLGSKQLAAPIDNVSLAGRLLTAPSIVEFYITKFTFPWKLASTYYWVYPKFTLTQTVLPLVVDLIAAGLIVYAGLLIRRKHPKTDFRVFSFFAAWTVLGVILYLQIVPLDMTVCETWFYFSVAGLLGMIGVALRSVKLRVAPAWLLVPVVVLLCILGIRSAFRGTDYRSQFILAQHDVAASPGDYSAMISISQHLIDQGNFKEAAAYAQRSIDIYPAVSNYNLLGVSLEQSGDYPGAAKAYNTALKYNNLSTVYENLGLILVVYSDPSTTSRFFQKALSVYPHDYKLWVYLAIFEGAKGSPDNAKAAIQNAMKYGAVPQLLYADIMTNQPFALPLLGKSLVVR